MYEVRAPGVVRGKDLVAVCAVMFDEIRDV
jgi:hypothetical protein